MPAFNHPPLVRHPSLQPLSRDHYVGLVQGRRLIKAAEGSVVDRRGTLAAFIDAWDSQIAEHFDDEDRLIAPLATETDRTRLYNEHRQLRAMVEEARQRRRQVDPGAGWMRSLGQTLTDHIRWEERELFPAIEANARVQLDDLREDADRLEMSRNRRRGRSTR